MSDASRHDCVPRIPVATYRLQFNREFRFTDAAAILPYLNRLGITDIYASPYFQARPGSMHGYDIVDPHHLNSEVGTAEEYEAMTAMLAELAMGQLLDIVPNHMGIAPRENAWWCDVLENGPHSIHGPFFDINWQPVKPELRDRVLLPVLGDYYGNVLDRGELRLVREGGSFFIDYRETRLPVRPRSYRLILSHGIDTLVQELGQEHPDMQELLSIVTEIRYLPLYTMGDHELTEERYREKEVAKRRIARLCAASPRMREFIDGNVARFNGTPGDAASMTLLHELLDEQIFRLAYWRVATEEINYRRFFDINDMAALRVELPEVFEEAHRLVLQLVREGKVTGLRVDHPDGLYHPAEYFRRLQKRCCVEREMGRRRSRDPALRRELEEMFDRVSEGNPSFKPFYIIAEKILMPDERIPWDWPIFSTTGYVFSNTVSGIFVDPDAEPLFTECYASFTGIRSSFADIVYDKKKLIMLTMSSEVNMLGHYLSRISEKDPHTRDFTLNSLTGALTETIALFPVYRTYVSGEGINDDDREKIGRAVAAAKRRNPDLEPQLDFLRRVLLLEYPTGMPRSDREEWLDFVMKFQQVTGPFMAKGLEDTALYVYNRLTSLNDVGGNPGRFGTPLEMFHQDNAERMRRWPHSLVATSTHDSKRGEDMRARINVLSEIPQEWEEKVRLWQGQNAPKKLQVDGVPIPDANDEYLLYQTLVGASPVGPTPEPQYRDFVERIRDYMVKAAREAKVHTSWTNTVPAYEEALALFVEEVLRRDPSNAFLYDFEQFLQRIERYAVVNSVAQTLLKITAPGVPDFYQGTELWNPTLVDPDNRRPVDYALHQAMLDGLEEEEAREGTREVAKRLVETPRDPRLKLFVTWKGLCFRRENAELFAHGNYLPLRSGGTWARNLCAFARRKGPRVAVTVVPRFLTQVTEHPQLLPEPESWKQTFIFLDFDERPATYRNILTGETFSSVGVPNGTALYISDILAAFPLALLESVTSRTEGHENAVDTAASKA